MKKRKIKTTEVLTTEQSTPPSWLGWFGQPIPLTPNHQFYSNILGYVLCGAGIILLSGFILIGYFYRPVILNEFLIEKTIQTNVPKATFSAVSNTVPDDTVLLLSGAKVFLNNEEQPVGYYLTSEPNKQSGLLIPMQYLNIPKEYKKINITFGFFYVGEPTISWGFQKNLTDKNVVGVDLSFTYNEDSEFSFLSAPTTVTQDFFSTPWTEAQYFILKVKSEIVTDVLLTHMTILGYSY